MFSCGKNGNENRLSSGEVTSLIQDMSLEDDTNKIDEDELNRLNAKRIFEWKHEDLKDTILLHYVRENNVQKLKSVLSIAEKYGMVSEIIDIKNEQEDTPLMLAVKEQLSEIVEILLSYGSKVTFGNKNYNKTLNLAVENGHTDTEILAVLLNGNYGQHFTDEEINVALTKVTDLKVAKLLLDKIENKFEIESLIKVVAKDNIELLKLFLEYKFDLNDVSFEITPLKQAVMMLKSDIVELLIESGADLTTDLIDLLLNVSGNEEVNNIIVLLLKKFKEIKYDSILDNEEIYGIIYRAMDRENFKLVIEVILLFPEIDINISIDNKIPITYLSLKNEYFFEMLFKNSALISRIDFTAEYNDLSFLEYILNEKDSFNVSILKYLIEKFKENEKVMLNSQKIAKEQGIKVYIDGKDHEVEVIIRRESSIRKTLK